MARSLNKSNGQTRIGKLFELGSPSRVAIPKLIFAENLRQELAGALSNRTISFKDKREEN